MRWSGACSAPESGDRGGGHAKSRAKPDAIFPNNWVSFHSDGTVVLYPMLAPNRRAERREEVIAPGARSRDLSHHPHRGLELSGRAAAKFLEGTGSLVLDRVHRVAYANLSPRTDLDVLGEFAQQLDYELVTFEALDARGHARVSHQRDAWRSARSSRWFAAR